MDASGSHVRVKQRQTGTGASQMTEFRRGNNYPGTCQFFSDFYQARITLHQACDTSEINFEPFSVCTQLPCASSPPTRTAAPFGSQITISLSHV